MKTIHPPTNCPSCDSILEWVNDAIYCRNQQCGSQQSKKIEHFAKTMKIKGLGPAAIEKLELANIQEIYYITEAEIAEAIGSFKVASKIYLEIENSKGASLNRILPALGIPLVGNTATEKLATVCNSIYDITEETCTQAGLGLKTTKSLLDWLVSNSWEEMPFSFKFDKPKVRTSGVVCITGKLKSFKTKAEATKHLENLGFIVKPSLTKDVTILINEGGVESAKTLKARNSGVTIIGDIKLL